MFSEYLYFNDPICMKLIIAEILAIPDSFFLSPFIPDHLFTVQNEAPSYLNTSVFCLAGQLNRTSRFEFEVGHRLRINVHVDPEEYLKLTIS